MGYSNSHSFIRCSIAIALTCLALAGAAAAGNPIPTRISLARPEPLGGVEQALWPLTFGIQHAGNLAARVSDQGMVGIGGVGDTSFMYPYPGGEDQLWLAVFEVGRLDSVAAENAGYGSPGALVDSPHDSYENFVDASAEIGQPVDLTSAAAPELTFYHRYSLENGYDFAYVEVASSMEIDDVFDDSPWNRYDENGYPGQSMAVQVNPLFDLTGPEGNERLTFEYIADFEGVTDNADGFVVDISNDGYYWEQIDPTNIQGWYDATLAAGGSNPLENQYAFCYDRTGWRTVTFDISAYNSYDHAKIRFRFGWDDTYGGGDGLAIRQISVDDDGGNLYYCDCSSVAGWYMDGTWSTTEARVGNWATAGGPYNGTLATYQAEAIDLSAYVGEPEVRVRFRLMTDVSVRWDGWYIDEVSIDDGGQNLFYDGFESGPIPRGITAWITDEPWGVQGPTQRRYGTVVWPAVFDVDDGWLEGGLANLGPGVSSEDWYAQFSSTSIGPGEGLDIEVEQYSGGWNASYPDDQEYLLFDYFLINTGAEALDNLYVGQWLNFDVDGDYGDEMAGYEPRLNLAYQYDDPGGTHAGCALLSHQPTSVNHDDNFGFDPDVDDEYLLDLLSNRHFDLEVTEPKEIHSTLSAGPFTVGAGETLEVVYAWAAGLTYDGLCVNILEAQRSWENGINPNAWGRFHDAGVVSIQSPGDTVGQATTVVPKATVANYGSYREEFDVVCSVEYQGETVWGDTVSVVGMGFESQCQVTFAECFVDSAAAGEATVYFYTLLGTDENHTNDTLSVTTWVTEVADGGVETPVPKVFFLGQNAPNPFTSSTSIAYALPERAPVRCVVYNVLGQAVRVLVDDVQDPGQRSVLWDGCDEAGRAVASGIYFYRLDAGERAATRKALHIR